MNHDNFNRSVVEGGEFFRYIDREFACYFQCMGVCVCMLMCKRARRKELENR